MRTIIVLLTSVALLSTAACSTFRGMGQDMKDAADTADKAV